MLMAKAMGNFAPSLTVYWISRPKWAALNTAPQIYTKKYTNIYRNIDMYICMYISWLGNISLGCCDLLEFSFAVWTQILLTDFTQPESMLRFQYTTHMNEPATCARVYICVCVSVCAACVCLCNRVCLNANLNNDNDINAPFSSCWLSSPFCVCFRSAIIIAKSVWGIASALSVYIYNICLCIARKYAYLGENERSM